MVVVEGVTFRWLVWHDHDWGTWPEFSSWLDCYLSSVGSRPPPLSQKARRWWTCLDLPDSGSIMVVKGQKGCLDWDSVILVVGIEDRDECQ